MKDQDPFNRANSAAGMAEEAENFTVEEWSDVTKDWADLSKEMARLARKRPEEERKKSGAEIAQNFVDGQEDSELFRVYAATWQLSDQALDRMIESFHNKPESKLGRLFRKKR